ncbi:hypothetical protein PFISCL1PPCAC_16250 [Pristionchus fissidentatus]|uniref:Uncharacterized protein n=1 Tax=Pristionchus fissidentatus TaxID=1538716 RepID=A0AAV5W2M5_9BILA|nr:hypothetical protein PFISCL1PPCAC_16250 [Pristionchus fissidentatus]
MYSNEVGERKVDLWRTKMDNSAETRGFRDDWKNSGGRMITDWIPVLITGSHNRLVFFSSRVGDGIILHEVHRGNAAVRTGAVFRARVEKSPPDPPHYHGTRYQVVQMDTRSPIETRGVQIDVLSRRGLEEVRVTTVVEVEQERGAYFLMSCDLIGVCFITKQDVFPDRPVAVGQTIRIFAHRQTSGYPSHWRVGRYEHVETRKVEGRQQLVRPVQRGRRAELQHVQQMQQRGEEKAVEQRAHNRSITRMSSEATVGPTVVSSAGLTRVTDIMRGMMKSETLVGLLRKTDEERGTRMYARILELIDMRR